MCRPIISFASVACVLVLATSGLVASHGSVHAADDCIAKPEGQGPQGSHWFYHTDETTNRKCWFLRADDGRILLGALDATEDAANDSRTCSTPGAPCHQSRRACRDVAGAVGSHATCGPPSTNCYASHGTSRI